MVKTAGLAVAVLLLATFEVGYFIKTIIWSIGSKLFRSRIHPLHPSVTYGKCNLTMLFYVLFCLPY